MTTARDMSVLSGRSKRPDARSRSMRIGFGAVGLLSTILLLLMGVAGALPWYLEHQTDSRLKLCRANMQALADIERRYYEKHGCYLRDLRALVRQGDIP